MNPFKFFLILLVVLIGLVGSKRSHQHHKSGPKIYHSAKVNAPPESKRRDEKADSRSNSKLKGPIHDEIIKNAERLTDTLVRVQRTAQSNHETRN